VKHEFEQKSKLFQSIGDPKKALKMLASLMISNRHKQNKEVKSKKNTNQFDLEDVIENKKGMAPSFGFPNMDFNDEQGPAKIQINKISGDACAWKQEDDVWEHMEKCFTFGKPLIHD
jgi:hypothetical protein